MSTFSSIFSEFDEDAVPYDAFDELMSGSSSASSSPIADADADFALHFGIAAAPSLPLGAVSSSLRASKSATNLGQLESAARFAGDNAPNPLRAKSAAAEWRLAPQSSASQAVVARAAAAAVATVAPSLGVLTPVAPATPLKSSKSSKTKKSSSSSSSKSKSSKTSKKRKRSAHASHSAVAAAAAAARLHASKVADAAVAAAAAKANALPASLDLFAAVDSRRLDELQLGSDALDQFQQQLESVRKLSEAEVNCFKRHKRLVKNRESAHQSRLRKKAYVAELENQVATAKVESDLAQKQLLARVAELQAENAQLRAQLA